jgi:hypothetical protein
MNFNYRIRLFLIGFIPGLIILVFILNKKGCTSPNELKILELRHQHLELGEKAKCKLSCLKTPELVFKINMRDFKVDYDLSEVRRKPYGLYYLKPIESDKYPYEMAVEDRDTITYINDFKFTKAIDCQCDSLN